ncbi:MAG: glutamine synthetase beta-grasp domain-containing protein, partial [Candidatus Marinimicrobia bacterium]|nr:glutamine synthetase beta-grasp domain-containing protein [Candidatus Neomarinimicrobiota bacterium]
MGLIKAEYIWIDGHKPTAKLRSKTKVFDGPVNNLNEIPEWGFDGSSTMQAEGKNSDCMLKPVNFIPDPIRGGDDILIMNEVRNADGSVHVSNTRSQLVEIAE